jgi:hypothetical protein
MIVEYSPGSGFRLVDPLDFRSFKLALKGEPAIGSPDSKGITLVDENNALIPIELVPTLPGRPKEKTWDSAYATMVASARKHGWIDVKSNAIRAHIERQF